MTQLWGLCTHTKWTETNHELSKADNSYHVTVSFDSSCECDYLTAAHLHQSLPHSQTVHFSNIPQLMRLSSAFTNSSSISIVRFDHFLNLDNKFTSKSIHQSHSCASCISSTLDTETKQAGQHNGSCVQTDSSSGGTVTRERRRAVDIDSCGLDTHTPWLLPPPPAWLHVNP